MERYSLNLSDPLSPAFGELHKAILGSVKSRNIGPAVRSLHIEILGMPWYRIIRRWHLERQLALMELALECYAEGIRVREKK